MNNTTREVLEFVKENDVKFIRLVFCDLFGLQKNISIMPDELENAFKEGVSFDASAINGFSDIQKSDLLLFPDPSTLAVLPWRPQQGRVVRFYCNIKNPNHSEFDCDTRFILKRTINKLEEKGYTCKIGVECEFYLFKTDEDGEPIKVTYDNGGYLDVSPLDKGENVRREICLCLEEMGIKPESSHHEQGPGQNEIDFKFSNPLTSANNFLTFKTVVKAIAARNGLFASFMPKPIENRSGNGMHINLSLIKNGFNMFKTGEEHSLISESFIAGILEKITQSCAVLNPTINSYERLGVFEAPKYVSWSHENRSQLIRIPASAPDNVRMELRNPDCSINPYLAFSLILSAGLYGIENELKLPKAVDADLYNTDEKIIKNLKQLPQNLTQALSLFKKSSFAREVIGEIAFDKYIKGKEEEERDYALCENKEEFYNEKYFRII